MSKAYDEGYSAFVDYNNYLVESKNNPYPPSSKEYTDWNEGWFDGVNEDESEWVDEDYYDDEEAEDYDDDEYLDDEDEDGYIEDIY